MNYDVINKALYLLYKELELSFYHRLLYNLIRVQLFFAFLLFYIHETIYNIVIQLYNRILEFKKKQNQ
jgi:hypothetical protein